MHELPSFVMQEGPDFRNDLGPRTNDSLKAALKRTRDDCTMLLRKSLPKCGAVFATGYGPNEERDMSSAVALLSSEDCPFLATETLRHDIPNLSKTSSTRLLWILIGIGAVGI